MPSNDRLKIGMATAAPQLAMTLPPLPAAAQAHRYADVGG